MPRLLLLLAAIVVLVGCGGEDPPTLARTLPVSAPGNASTASAPMVALAQHAPDGVYARAATLVAEQTGYRYTFAMALRGVPDLPGGGSFAISGSGNVDQAAKRSSMQLDIAGLRELLLASGEVDAAELDRYLGDGSIDLIQDGDSYYLRMPFLATLEGANTPWVAVAAPSADTNDLGLGGLGGFGGMGLFGGMGNPGTPADYLEHLKAIDSGVTVVGSEVVRGVSTTHYRGALNLGALLGASAGTPEQRPELDAMLGLLANVALPYEVWIDADGLPRRIATTLDFGAFAPTGSGFGAPSGVAAPSMVFGYELFDYGDPGRIDLPPASEVTVIDLDELEGLEGPGY